MGFLSPWFLAGAAALSIPLWMHLLRQFNRTPLPFSSLLFFERRIQSSTSRRRLRYLVLLALRVAVLLLLALAFANPFVNRPSAAVQHRTLAVIAIDRSFSMRHGDRMQQAKTLAHLFVNALPPGSRAQVLGVDSHVDSLTGVESDKGVLNAAIDTIAQGDQASSYGELSRALRVMDQSNGTRLQVHFIGDAQQTSMPASFSDLQLGPHTSFEVQTVGQTDLANWAVESVTVPAHVYDPSQTRFAATIAGWNTKPAAKRVSLVLDGSVLAMKDISVPDCGRAEVEFIGVQIPYGAHRGEIRIEPHDALPQDDSFAFSTERSDARKVLFLYAHGRSRDALFYKAALESAASNGLTVQPEAIEQAASSDFSKYAFVVLNDPGAMDEALEQEICAYVSKGGAALIAIGPATARTRRVPVGRNDLQVTAQTQGAGWFDAAYQGLAGGSPLAGVQFVTTPVIATKPHSRVAAKFADGAPLLMEEPDGEGKILLFASTLDNSVSDFPLHSSFVPFVARTAAYLSGAEENAATLRIGSSVALRNTNAQTTAADVIGPDGTHELSLSDATRAAGYQIQRAGFYDVRRADGRRFLIAANPDRRESDLSTVPAETLALWRNTAGQAEKTSAVSDQPGTVPFPLWRYFLALTLVMALAESIFAKRYLRERQTL